jgi:hypothetical protein
MTTKSLRDCSIKPVAREFILIAHQLLHKPQCGVLVYGIILDPIMGPSRQRQ